MWVYSGITSWMKLSDYIKLPGFHVFVNFYKNFMLFVILDFTGNKDMSCQPTVVSRLEWSYVTTSKYQDFMLWVVYAVKVLHLSSRFVTVVIIIFLMSLFFFVYFILRPPPKPLLDIIIQSESILEESLGDVLVGEYIPVNQTSDIYHVCLQYLLSWDLVLCLFESTKTEVCLGLLSSLYRH